MDGYLIPCKRNIPFSNCHGNNLEKVTDFDFTWKQQQQDGFCVSKRPIRKKDKYEMIINGDGHVYVGLVNKLPSLKEMQSGSMALTSNITIYEIRLRKQTSIVCVEYVEKQKITLHQQENPTESPYNKLVNDKDSWYLCSSILFGNMTVTLRSVVPTNNKTEDLLWSVNSGLNILRSPDGRSVQLKNTNPLALCGSTVMLCPKQLVKLIVKPVPNCQYGYLSIAVSNHTPDSLKLDSVKRFYSGQIESNMSALKQVRLNGSGHINFWWDGGNKIKIQEHRSLTITDINVNEPLYLILELFRTQVSIATQGIVPNQYLQLRPTASQVENEMEVTPAALSSEVPLPSLHLSNASSMSSIDTLDLFQQSSTKVTEDIENATIPEVKSEGSNYLTRLHEPKYNFLSTNHRLRPVMPLPISTNQKPVLHTSAQDMNFGIDRRLEIEALTLQGHKNNDNSQRSKNIAMTLPGYKSNRDMNICSNKRQVKRVMHLPYESDDQDVTFDNDKTHVMGNMTPSCHMSNDRDKNLHLPHRSLDKGSNPICSNQVSMNINTDVDDFTETERQGCHDFLQGGVPTRDFSASTENPQQKSSRKDSCQNQILENFLETSLLLSYPEDWQTEDYTFTSDVQEREEDDYSGGTLSISTVDSFNMFGDGAQIMK